jgi:membrane protein DedA with SNARE-associated domain
MSDLLATLAQWAVDIVYSFGYVGVFVLIALVNLHLLPIPTQLILGLAGFLVGQGRFSLILVLVASTAGAVVASLVLYCVGLWIGEASLYRLIKRFERFKLVFGSDLDRASEVFERHGGKAVLIGHLVPAVGALISVPAGLKRMPIFGRFMFYTVFGSALWNGAFIVLGLMLGSNWTSVKQYASIIEYVVLAVMAGGFLWLLWRRWKARRSLKRSRGL